MEKVEWKVEGMTCTNCALTINRFLEKQGAQKVAVDFIGQEISFELNGDISKESLAKGIKDLGYKVAGYQPTGSNGLPTTNSKLFFTNHLQRFLFCLPFTIVLLLHMLPWHIHFLMNPWIQLAICTPVFLVGMGYFGVSAFKSLRRGIPNMN